MNFFYSFLKAATLLVVVFSLEGCILLDLLVDNQHHGHRRHRNSSMSKAIETGNAGRVVSSRPYYPPPVTYSSSTVQIEHDSAMEESGETDRLSGQEDDGLSSSDDHAAEAQANKPSFPPAFHYSLYNQVSGHDYLEDTVVYSFAIEAGEEKLSAGGRLSFANMAFRDDWIYANELTRPTSVDIAVEGKIYFSERKHFFRPYVGAYVAYGALFWSYRTPLIDSETGEEIRTDHVDYLKVGAMTGLSVRISKSVRIAAEIRPEVTFTGTTTNQGFFNDVIDNSNATYAGIHLIFIGHE